MSDIFDNFFGDSRGRGRASGGRERGADLRYNLEVSLEDAFTGSNATIKIPTSLTCEVCSGTGAKAGSKPKACPTCGGYGRVRATQGFFSIERTCPNCHGRGETLDDPCGQCGGAGRVTRERTLSVNVPAGVEDGTRIRLAGEGEAGLRGSPAGDLYVDISIRQHPLFQRDGANIFVRVPLRMTQAAMGGAVEVPSVDGGRARVTIPAGTQAGDQFRLRGKGFSVLRSAARGDMYVQVSVETPQNLTKKQRELLEEFEAEAVKAGRTSPESEGFFAKVKEFFEDLKQ
jgi:molecular chaperone DnaJ